MNGELLFRGKRSDNGEWVYGYYLPCYYSTRYGRIPAIFVNDDNAGVTLRIPVRPETVGRFTGLYDKNKNRIFEDDIVLKRTYHGKEKFQVEFDGGMFYAGIGGGSSTPTHRYTLEDSRIEVVGNIFD